MSRKSATLALTPYAYLQLSDQAGVTAADASGNARHFTYNNTAGTLNGITLKRPGSLSGDLDQAIRMQSSYAASPFLLNASTASVALRVRFNGAVPTGADSRVAGFADAASGAVSTDKIIGVDATGKLFWYVFNGVAQRVTAPTACLPGVWYDVLVTIGPAGQVLYVNGVQAAANAGVTTSFTGYVANNVFVGGSTSLFALITDMDVDEYAVFNSELTAANARTLYNSAVASAAVGGDMGGMALLGARFPFIGE